MVFAELAVALLFDQVKLFLKTFAELDLLVQLLAEVCHFADGIPR